MKTVSYYVRHILILSITLILFLNFSFSQIIPKDLRKIFPPIQQDDVIPNLNCSSPITPNNCNYIHNEQFVPSSQYDCTNFYHVTNPFIFQGQSLVPSWEVATGTPTINCSTYFPTPPHAPLAPNGAGYFFAGTTYDPSKPNPETSEGIVQKIPPLNPSKTYTLNFYKTFMDFSYLGPPYGTDPVDHFQIVLMRCQDYVSTFYPLSYAVPALPAFSQTIYCEIDVANPNWEQVFFKFTPNYAYDMIWIYPQRNPGNNFRISGIFVSSPELIDVSNFSAGNNVNPTPPNCNILIGPSTPNCVPTGARFTWRGPNNQTQIVPNPLVSQQIQINASDLLNVGTWTLQMTMPNAVTTNSNCSQQQDAQHPVLVSASINVAYCPGPCTTPTITQGPINICSFWEGISNPAILTTNILYNIQWYRNGIIIPGANTPTYYAYADGGQGNTVKTYTYTVRNTTPGCNYESLSTTVNFVPYPAAFSSTTLCRNSPINLYAPDYGPNSSYFWNIPGAIITPNQISRQIQVTFPVSYTNPYFDTYITVTNQYGCNGTDYFRWPFVNNCFSYTNTNGINIYPNPASNQITITSNEVINNIEIFDLLTPVLKKIKINNTKSTTLNVSDLPPGIYNCKISTTNGTENQKLIIKR